MSDLCSYFVMFLALSYKISVDAAHMETENIITLFFARAHVCGCVLMSASLLECDVALTVRVHLVELLKIPKLKLERSLTGWNKLFSYEMCG